MKSEIKQNDKLPMITEKLLEKQASQHHHHLSTDGFSPSKHLDKTNLGRSQMNNTSMTKTDLNSSVIIKS